MTRPAPGALHGTLISNEIQSQATERHYTVKELADKWSLDESTIRKIFRDEDGVLLIGSPGIRARRKQYVTLRIPESVMLRVYFSRINQRPASTLPGRAVPGRQQRRERSASRSSE